jgi:hypothetical protein
VGKQVTGLMIRGTRSDRFIKTPEELTAELSHLARECQSKRRLGLFEMKSQSGFVMGIVLGGTESALSFGRADGEPPYFASEGAASDDEPMLATYLDLHHHTELPRWSVISVEAATDAAKEFLETGLRPTRVGWREV